ncbi:MAG: hypothetical protein WAN35_19755, partial [Terracidiphilus sp.]
NPRISLVVVFIIGGLLASGCWRILAYQVGSEKRTSIAPAVSTGSATTTGDGSPAITGSGNVLTYDQSSQGNKKRKPQK